jgi:hypothetical protein
MRPRRTIHARVIDPTSPDRYRTPPRPSARHVIGKERLRYAKSRLQRASTRQALLFSWLRAFVPPLFIRQSTIDIRQFPYRQSATTWHIEKNVLAKRTHLTFSLYRLKSCRRRSGVIAPSDNRSTAAQSRPTQSPKICHFGGMHPVKSAYPRGCLTAPSRRRYDLFVPMAPMGSRDVNWHK